MMKRKLSVKALIVLLFMVSCAYNSKIATVKNNTSSTVACALLKNGIMTDSLLYSDTSYMGYLIQPQHYDTYTLPDSNLTNAPNSAKTYIYILKLDSLNKFRKLKLVNGILTHSLLKKIEVQLNKVQEPVDTIYVK
ncbi:hypothetical protein [Mucilaginibacter flavus]|uniref:hypothetical protein n=1 Tax=Mucilaginibacter flavus TaxID=931504 RepID=UPI0025B5C587|nr:hypothetical protein [Mucilaginibacter flavus]MDN3584253.1 hypothetical protein [Mucilaginibacter flavus]